MRSTVVYLVLLACLFTEEDHALALELRQPQGRRVAEIDVRTLTGNAFTLTNGTVLEVSPLSDTGREHMSMPQFRRRLGDFRECSPCTCCDSTRRWCLPTVCCYHINCGVRDLPFGLCSFTPISCSCLGCRD